MIARADYLPLPPQAIPDVDMDSETQQADNDGNAAFESDGIVESGEEGEGSGEVNSQEEFESSHNEEDGDQLDEVSPHIFSHFNMLTMFLESQKPKWADDASDGESSDLPENIFAADVRRKAPSRADTTSYSEDGLSLPPSTDAGDMEDSDGEEDNRKVSFVSISDISCLTNSFHSRLLVRARRRPQSLPHRCLRTTPTLSVYHLPNAPPSSARPPDLRRSCHAVLRRSSGWRWVVWFTSFVFTFAELRLATNVQLVG